MQDRFCWKCSAEVTDKKSQLGQYKNQIGILLISSTFSVINTAILHLINIKAVEENKQTF